MRFMTYLWPVLWAGMLVFMACSKDGFRGCLAMFSTLRSYLANF